MNAEHIEYNLVLRKGMRSIRLRVLEPDGTVVVSAGTRRSRKEIDAFVADHAEWIWKRRAEIANKKPRFPVLYEDGEQFLLWDKPLTLRVTKKLINRCSHKLEGDELVVTIPVDSSIEDVERMFKSFMRRELTTMLEIVLPRCELMTGIKTTGVQIRDMSSRWGSCTVKTGKIRIALKLASYPPECLVMILVHELAHIRYPNHGEEFYAFMDERYPNWRRVKDLLKD